MLFAMIAKTLGFSNQPVIVKKVKETSSTGIRLKEFHRLPMEVPTAVISFFSGWLKMPGSHLPHLLGFDNLILL
jgi:hypothetical protein